MIHEIVKCRNPQSDKLVMLLNLAANAFNDKDLEEEYRDIKRAALAEARADSQMKKEEIKMTETNYFTALNSVNVAEHIEKKNGLSYLSWAWAWGELKKRHPKAYYTVYEDAEGRFYHTDGRTAWVKTGVTVDDLEHIEYLPVMDYRNKSIPVNALTSFDVNKAIQRSLTKAVARHGLGLYIYAGEDLPEDDAAQDKKTAKKPSGKATAKPPAKSPDEPLNGSATIPADEDALERLEKEIQASLLQEVKQKAEATATNLADICKYQNKDSIESFTESELWNTIKILDKKLEKQTQQSA